jgi:hypothetical protein
MMLALHCFEMAYGPEHASIVETLHSLLNLYAKQGRDADAEALCMPYLQALFEHGESNKYGKGSGLQRRRDGRNDLEHEEYLKKIFGQPLGAVMCCFYE